jgi:hypothetical protein
MDGLGGPGEVARLGDRHEVLELMELHPAIIGVTYRNEPDHVLDR